LRRLQYLEKSIDSMLSKLKRLLEDSKTRKGISLSEKWWKENEKMTGIRPCQQAGIIS